MTSPAVDVPAPPERPTDRALIRFNLDPAAYCHREWLPSKLRHLADQAGSANGSRHGRSALSAALLQRYRLDSAFDSRLLDGARRAVLLSPASFETFLVMAGIVRHRVHVLSNLDARLFRSLQSAVPGVDIAALLDRVRLTDDGLDALPKKSPVPRTPSDTPCVSVLAEAGERMLLEAASAWGKGVRGRVCLRLRRRHSKTGVAPECDVATQGRLEAHLDGCLASLEGAQWL